MNKLIDWLHPCDLLIHKSVHIAHILLSHNHCKIYGISIKAYRRIWFLFLERSSLLFVASQLESWRISGLFGHTLLWDIALLRGILGYFVARDVSMVNALTCRHMSKFEQLASICMFSLTSTLVKFSWRSTQICVELVSQPSIRETWAISNIAL